MKSSIFGLFGVFDVSFLCLAKAAASCGADLMKMVVDVGKGFISHANIFCSIAVAKTYILDLD